MTKTDQTLVWIVRRCTKLQTEQIMQDIQQQFACCYAEKYQLQNF
ncbi:unnamed protein product [Paramecium octaurelia]|uniref:Uncharacterized protein n=1 Tax=Paramecium octaurelia TaxID=43137 RepID=A0A8S1XA39_PAROT|nr:unnamed protein product [Paramecium octaurelia]